jgi:hypothetical protein
LAGGGLQFAGGRGRFRATEGLDASAHGGRVQRGPSALLPSPRQRLILTVDGLLRAQGGCAWPLPASGDSSPPHR